VAVFHDTVTYICAAGQKKPNNKKKKIERKQDRRLHFESKENIISRCELEDVIVIDLTARPGTLITIHLIGYGAKELMKEKAE
jgi:hypothetical protein